MYSPSQHWLRDSRHDHNTQAESQFNLSRSVCNGVTSPCVLTYHNDPSRSGVNSEETILKPPLTSFAPTNVITDGLIFAQPLYIHGLQGNKLPSSCQAPNNNVVFVATENNSVYAINTAGTVCWQKSLNNGSNESAIPYTSMPLDKVYSYPCTDIIPQIGITGTPVIDTNVTPPALYVVSSHQVVVGGNTTYDQRLHVLRADSGDDVKDISIPPVLGSTYNPLLQNQRAGLALYSSNYVANVYVTFGSHCDSSNFGPTPTNYYDGFVAGFQLNYRNLANGFSSIGKFTSEPFPATSNNKGGIWMGGAAPAVDSNGNLYVGVGNGSWVSQPINSDEWGNSVVKISSNMQGEDFYTPNDWSQLDNGSNIGVCFVIACPPGSLLGIAMDTDMSTGGVVLLSSSELVSIGKQGMLYVIPYSAASNGVMGGLDGGGYTGLGSDPTKTDCTTSGTGSIVQCFEALPFVSLSGDQNGLRGAPAFWSAGPPGTAPNLLFSAGLHDYLRAFSFNGSTFTNTSNPYIGPDQMGPYPGGGVSVTWNGSDPTTGIVWVLDTSGAGSIKLPGSGCPPNCPPSWTTAGPATLYAYQANPPSSGTAITSLWNSKSISSSMPGS